MTILYIVIAVFSVIAVILTVVMFNTFLEHDREDYANREERREYGEERKPTFNLKREGVRVFNIPFTPENTEVFYLENDYDENANKFIKENKDYIKSSLAKKGFTFVYLPDVNIPADSAKLMIDYMSPGGNDADLSEIRRERLQSNFLLDYMVLPENRNHMKSSFAWYRGSEYILSHSKQIYIFNYISFDSEEALENPKKVIDQVVLGITGNIIPGGLFSTGTVNPESDADDNFNNEEALSSEERQALEDIRSKLDCFRKRGISEAIISKYIKPYPKLSHMTITSDFRIIMDDYKGIEIKMEPLVKAVYILFLRHPEGIMFKHLPDYRNELEIIYRAIKSRKNNIDKSMASVLTPKISPNIEALCDPTKNSINEKCTRIKEAFVSNFHDCIASHYYINGSRYEKKLIPLTRNFVKWEGGEA